MEEGVAFMFDDVTAGTTCDREEGESGRQHITTSTNPLSSIGRGHTLWMADPSLEWIHEYTLFVCSREIQDNNNNNINNNDEHNDHVTPRSHVVVGRQPMGSSDFEWLLWTQKEDWSNKPVGERHSSWYSCDEWVWRTRWVMCLKKEIRPITNSYLGAIYRDWERVDEGSRLSRLNVGGPTRWQWN